MDKLPDIRTVMETMPVGYAEINSDMSFRHANTAFRKALDYSPEEFASLKLTDISADEENARKVFSIVLKGEEPKEEFFVLKRRNGTYIYVLARSAPLTDEKGVFGVRAIFIDKTEQVLVEHSLRASEKRFREIFETLPIGYSEIDSQMQVTYINEELTRMTGYTMEDIEEGITLPDVLPEKEKLKKNFIRAMQGGRQDPEHYQLKCKDGTVIFTIIRSTPLFFDGESVGIRSVIIDITPRVRAEQRMKATIEEKETLINEIHHRVKNNLQIIGSLIDLQAEEMGGSAHILAQFQNTQDRIKAMALIHEKLYESQDLSGINFKEYLGSLIGYMRQVYTSSRENISVESELDDIRLPVNVSIPCGLIVTELISNACKHAFPDGRKGSVSIRFSRKGNKSCILEVNDDGIGYSNPRGFSSSQSMGIQLVNMFVEQIRGEISVNVMKGTHVKLRFPQPVPSDT